MSGPRRLGCVLAGGRSSRMGEDKARLQWRGRLLVEHAVATLRAAGCEVVIAGARPDLAEYAPVVEDRWAGCGPLGGIEAALSRSVEDGRGEADAIDRTVLCMAVDLPMLPVSFAALLLDRAERTGAWATVPVLGGRAQPLCAVYRGELLRGVRAALEAGQYRVRRAVEDATIEAPAALRDFFSVEAVTASRGGLGETLAVPQWFANVNTPQDWARLAGSQMT